MCVAGLNHGKSLLVALDLIPVTTLLAILWVAGSSMKERVNIHSIILAIKIMLRGHQILRGQLTPKVW